MSATQQVSTGQFGRLASVRQNFRQMTAAINTPGGGFSRNLTTGEEASADTWMVSRATGEQKFDGPVKNSDVVRYARKNKETLTKPGAHIGGWNDEGKPTLDISDAIPQLNNARRVAKANNQDGIYNPGTGEYRMKPNY